MRRASVSYLSLLGYIFVLLEIFLKYFILALGHFLRNQFFSLLP